MFQGMQTLLEGAARAEAIERAEQAAKTAVFIAQAHGYMCRESMAEIPELYRAATDLPVAYPPGNESWVAYWKKCGKDKQEDVRAWIQKLRLWCDTMVPSDELRDTVNALILFIEETDRALVALRQRIEAATGVTAAL